MKDFDYQRNNFQVNLESRVTDKFTVGTQTMQTRELEMLVCLEVMDTSLQSYLHSAAFLLMDRMLMTIPSI